MKKQKLIDAKAIVAFMFAMAFVFIGCQKSVENTKNNNISQNETHKETASEKHEHDHSVQIEGRKMKSLTVRQVADLWEINPKALLANIIEEFDFKKHYTIDTILDEMRKEYKFSPAIIKDIAEEIKTNEAP